MTITMMMATTIAMTTAIAMTMAITMMLMVVVMTIGTRTTMTMMVFQSACNLHGICSKSERHYCGS